MERAPKPRIFARLLRVALVTLALGYVAICLLVFVEQRQLLYHPIIRTAGELNQLAQAANLERWTNATGQFIGLKRCYTNAPAAGSILMLYGNGNTAVGCADYADVIQHTAPFDFYVMEYPGYEDRPGPLDGQHILSAAKEAFQRLDTTKPIYLVGESLGTGPASYLAGAFPKKVAGIILLSPYNCLADVAQSHYPFLPARWLLLDDFYPAQYLQTYHGLVGMVIDDRDSVIPASLAHRLYDGLSGPKHLWEYPDCNHVQLGEPPETFWKSVLEFWRTANVTRVAANVPQAYPEYQRCIRSIYRNVVDLTAPTDLLALTNFLTLYTNSAQCQPLALRFLADQTNDDECKMVVVYSLQTLPLDDYIDYETQLLQMAQAGRISRTLFNRALFPTLEWSTKMECNFQKPEITALLGKIQSSGLLNDFNQGYVKRIFSGLAKQDVADMQDGGLLSQHK